MIWKYVCNVVLLIQSNNLFKCLIVKPQSNPLVINEFLTDVRKSGLYSTEKIDRRALDIINFRSKIIAEQRRDLKSKEATLKIRDATINENLRVWERQEKKIIRLPQEIHFLRKKDKKCWYDR